MKSQLFTKMIAMAGISLALFSQGLQAGHHSSSRSSHEVIERKINNLKNKVEALDKKILSELDSIESDLKCDTKVMHISEHDLPFVIHKSGVYCLTEESTYNPNNSGTAAITIDADNVVLDLNSHTLSQGSTASSTTVGVLVNGSHSNIVVKNGRIENFTQNGLLFDSSCSEILIESLVATGNGTTTSPSSVVANSTGGLFLIDAVDVIIRNSNFDQNFGFGGGITITGGQNILIESCTCNLNAGSTMPALFNVTGTIGSGLALIGSSIAPFTSNPTNIWVQNSSFNSNTASECAAGVISITFAGNNIDSLLFDNCTFNANNITDSIANAIAYGLLFQSTDDFVVKHCVASQNSGVNGGTNSSANGFAVTSPTSGSGLLLAVAGVFEDCQAFDNFGNVPALSSPLSSGFLLFNTSHVFIRDSQAFISTQLPTGSVVGYRLDLAGATPNTGFRNVLDHCLAMGFKGSFSRGIFATNQTEMTIQNCTIEDNGDGVAIVGANTRDCVVHNNNCTGNDRGFFDNTSTATRNVYFSNVAAYNGIFPASTATDNYNSSISGVFNPSLTCPSSCSASTTNANPIRSWFRNGTVPNGPGPCQFNNNCIAGENLDNISISN